MIKSLILNSIVVFPLKDDAFKLPNKSTDKYDLISDSGILNPNNLPQVNHKDENKLNNSVNNLEWCTAKYNCNYGTRNKKISSPVLCIELNKKYNSIKEASEDLKIFYSNISHCCSNSKPYKTAGGYHWKYIKEV